MPHVFNIFFILSIKYLLCAKLNFKLEIIFLSAYGLSVYKFCLDYSDMPCLNCV